MAVVFCADDYWLTLGKPVMARKKARTQGSGLQIAADGDICTADYHASAIAAPQQIFSKWLVVWGRVVCRIAV